MGQQRISVLQLAVCFRTELLVITAASTECVFYGADDGHMAYDSMTASTKPLVGRRKSGTACLAITYDIDPKKYLVQKCVSRCR